MPLLRQISLDGHAKDVQNFVAGQNVTFATQSDGSIQINASGGDPGGCVTYNLAWDSASKSFRLTDSEGAVVQSEVLTGVAMEAQTGDLADLTTTDKTSLVAAINELAGSAGEPFRVKNWSASGLNVTIPVCTSDIANTGITALDFEITGQEGTDYQIVGMIAYEVSDANGARINCWPVCQFTQNTQKLLRVRMMCAGTTDKVAARLNAWVLLKRRA